eukprot:1606761-Rhodomonas_salina.2
MERTLVIKDALFYSSGDINLIATDDLNMMNWDVIIAPLPYFFVHVIDHFSMHPVRSGLFLYYITKSMNVPIALVPLGVVDKLRTLPVTDDELAACFHASCRSMSLEEQMHECMAHAQIPKLESMSQQVNRLPRPLHFAKLLRLQCSLCYTAKAKRQNYPDASTTTVENEDDLMTWDLINVCEEWITL